VRLVAAVRLAGRLGRRARALGLEAAQRRARDAAGESLGRLPSTSLLGFLPTDVFEVAAGEDPVSGTRKIDVN
jgi:hypothetical protein